MQKTCKVEGCNKKATSTGWCTTHHGRYYRNGNVNIVTRTHGDHYKGTPEHNSWSAAKQRCYNKNTKFYPNYGGRGIKMCDRWLEKPYGFRNFLEDMGKKPDGDYSLDRIDPNGDYCPENCRWASRIEQNCNRRWGKGSSKIPGVWKYNNKYWCASVGINGKTIIRYAKTKKEAARKRDQLLLEYYPNIKSS